MWKEENKKKAKLMLVGEVSNEDMMKRMVGHMIANGEMIEKNSNIEQ